MNRTGKITTGCLLALCCLTITLGGAGRASAAILPAQVHSVPGGNIIEMGNVALSEDGSGGAVFIAAVGGVRHVFATTLRNNVWSAPVRIDTGQAFDSFQPRIGVGDGGRAVVIWVQRGPIDQNGPHDRLYSSSLDPGAMTFEPPVMIDGDIGPADFAYPDIAMNAVGTAYLVYRNLPARPPLGTVIPAGYAFIYTKLARYNGAFWSRLDQVANRNGSVAVRFPTADNAPKVAIASNGSGAVAFQEPDVSTYSRIWTRRIFGSSPGPPLLTSPTEYASSPLEADADAISLSMSRAGAVAVAFRQATGNNSKLDRAHIMTNRISDPADINSTANVFQGALMPDVAPAPSDTVPGKPYIRLNRSAKGALAFALGDRSFTASSIPQLEDPIELGPPAGAGPAQDVFTAVSDDDARVHASIAGETVRLWEGASGQAANISVPGGEEVEALKFAANDSGDAAVAGLQKTASGLRLLLGNIDSPPDRTYVSVPERCLRTANPGVWWVKLPDGSGPVRYDLRQDGRVLASSLGNTMTLAVKKDGRQAVTLDAVDAVGQRFEISSFDFCVDRKAPVLKLRRGAGGLVVATLTDGSRGEVSGVSSGSRIKWDGARSKKFRSGRASHRFRRGGVVSISVEARDRAGNARSYSRKLRLP